MKLLLTFIYGLLHIALAFILIHNFFNTEEWYRWIILVIGIISLSNGIDKLDKATE